MQPNDLSQLHEALMQFVYRAPIGLLQTALDGRVEMMNPTAASLLIPLSRSGQLDNLFAALADVLPELQRTVDAYDQPSGMVCEFPRISLDAHPGPNVPATVAISILKLDPIRLMVTVTDVTLAARHEQHNLERRLNAAARTDGLTQMPNRAEIRDLIQRALHEASPVPGKELAVVFINCDRFKRINDSLGSAVGDEVLGLMADRLRSALRQRSRLEEGLGSGNVAARVGGDEFVVLVTDLQCPDDVHAVAERLLAVLCQPYGIRSHQVHCTVSMGIVLRAQISGAAADVLQDSSIAMVEAKRGGGARYVIFEPAMQSRAAQRSGIESDLRKAIGEEGLQVHYQPVVGLRCDGTVAARVDRSAGVEALVRWNHPDRGAISPCEFIGIAEECGLIGALGEFVLRTACCQFVRWQAELGERAPRQLAVNLSRGQLAQPGFVDIVRGILHSSGMRPGALQLEVTESLAAQDASVQSQLRELKGLGLTLALDDFGTGYSSLASLHLLPVETIKIDRSFVAEAVVSEHHRVLIEATMRVAQSLRMTTVAEGIETAAQLDIVRRLGCDKAQGYFLAMPQSAADLVRWLDLA